MSNDLRPCGHPLGSSAWCYACAEAEYEASPRQRLWSRATHPQAPASPQPEAEAHKAVARDENKLLADFYEASGTMVNGDQVFGTIRHNDLLQLIRSARDTTSSAGAPLPEHRQCIAADPLCPCADGDTCHYEGNNPFSLPEQRQEAAQMPSEKEVDALVYESREKEWTTIQFVREAVRRFATPIPQAVKVPLTDEQLLAVYRKHYPDAVYILGEERGHIAVLACLRDVERTAHGIHPTEGEQG